ncbi:glycosyltransferase involved in cell wall biosynthesis [Methylovorus glucosotrophus]|uniref:glycosyltransferase family 2 protein n=1 Tax=Methylovorus glucosotrophus TaxID=266009 RepID=UPI001331BEF2|nr:glycosyltransferase family 2 protein [Methylovorus glucosotrophus]KAF0843629.1 glycosyltransferase involved in cell wall biosynthesis [Methylovorus glucosotrophus]
MRVSIYMPTKNRLASLQLAVNSVLAQSYQDIELLVVDDGSTDGSREYLKALEMRDPRVRIFLNSHSHGACHARNIAIKAATGDFLTGIDDDDEFLPHHIAALLDYWHFLEKYETAPVSCIFPQALTRISSEQRVGLRRARVAYQSLFESNYIGNQIFTRREYFINTQGFDESMPAWQDLEFFFRVLKTYGEARLMDIPSYIFDETPRPDRLSVGKKNLITAACRRMMEKHAEDPRQQQSLWLQVFARHYGFQPDLLEILQFMKLGFWPGGYKRILKVFSQKFRWASFPKENRPKGL